MVDHFFVPTGRQVLSGGLGAADRVILHDQLSNPANQNGNGSFDMATGLVTWQVGGDRLRLPATGFERASIFSGGIAQNTWLVRGTDQDNFVRAPGAAVMRFDALAGDDVFQAGFGDDFYDGGNGTDSGVFMANDGSDTCISVEVLRRSNPCPAG